MIDRVSISNLSGNDGSPDGGTKAHLVEYYRAVAQRREDGSPGPLVRALADRPTYLQRFPDGVDGDEVYQKRVPAHAPG